MSICVDVFICVLIFFICLHLTFCTCSTLTALPSPWAGIARADIQQEILLTSRHLAGTRSTSSIVSSEERQDWLTQLASALPVFVINLDKRADRYTIATPRSFHLTHFLIDLLWFA